MVLRNLGQINKYFFKYKWHLTGGTIFIAISNVFAIYPAKITRDSFNLLKAQLEQALVNDQRSFSEAVLKSILIYALLIIGSALLKGLFMFFMRQTIIVMSRHIEYDQKNEIFDKYLSLPQSFYKRNNTGDLMNRISEDVGKVRMYTGPAIMYMINLFLMSIMVIYTMVQVNLELTIYVLAPLPIMAVLIYFISNKIEQRSGIVQKKLSDLSTFSQEAFSGIRILKAFSSEKIFASVFNKEVENYKNESLKLAKIEAGFSPILLALVGLSTILTIYIGGQKVIEGKITIGNIAEFVLYVNLLTWPFTSLGWVSSLTQRAEASQKRINEFLNFEDHIISNEKTELGGEVNITFKNVNFTYPETGIHALKNISFKIESGKTLGIIGRTGSGKSTMAALLCRLYDVNSGEIIIGDKNIKRININNLRQNIGYVPQDVFLFSDTVYNNISFGLTQSTATKEKVETAAKNAVVYDNIIEFKEGFETVIGERGVTLSGGQKQRISIARAIIKEPKILIFDDCLSAVDTETEDAILKNLKKIMKGRTSVIISHRVSSVKDADHIIVIDNGEIVEQGSSSELFTLNGMYATLYKQQNTMLIND